MRSTYRSRTGLTSRRRSRRRGKNPGATILFVFVPALVGANILLSTPCSPGLLDIGKDPADLMRECIAYRAEKGSGADSNSLIDPSTLLSTPLGDLALDMVGLEADSPETQALIDKYKHLVPSNGRVTEDDLRRLPADLKAKCDSSCREKVKSYLRKQDQKEEP